jgi:hypothetical protein
MKKTAFIILLLSAIALAGCSILNEHAVQKGAYVRIVNTGNIPTKAYILNEYTHHKYLQHFFPGLKPGDSTSYLHFKRLNTEKLTVVLDSFAISRDPVDHCNNCDIVSANKVTVYIKLMPRKDTGNMPAIEVRYGN